MESDKDDVHFEIAKGQDDRIWVLTITCKEGLDQDEFAAACILLGQDILEGKISVERGDEADAH